MFVDLSLASSYVPAILCLAKSVAMATTAFFILPHGGGPALALCLVFDRIFCFYGVVFDVNAVVAFVLALCVAVEERHRLYYYYYYDDHHNNNKHGAFAITATTNNNNKGTSPSAAATTTMCTTALCVWALVAFIQTWRRLMSVRWELVCVSCLAVFVSFTHQSKEPLPLFLTQVILFVVVVMVGVYMSAVFGARERNCSALTTTASANNNNNATTTTTTTTTTGYPINSSYFGVFSSRRHQQQQGGGGGDPSASIFGGGGYSPVVTCDGLQHGNNSMGAIVVGSEFLCVFLMRYGIVVLAPAVHGLVFSSVTLCIYTLSCYYHRHVSVDGLLLSSSSSSTVVDCGGVVVVVDSGGGYHHHHANTPGLLPIAGEEDNSEFVLREALARMKGARAS
jgi:hypothetical protein